MQLRAAHITKAMKMRVCQHGRGCGYYGLGAEILPNTKPGTLAAA
jgi:hypothetical protein